MALLEGEAVTPRAERQRQDNFHRSMYKIIDTVYKVTGTMYKVPTGYYVIQTISLSKMKMF